MKVLGGNALYPLATGGICEHSPFRRPRGSNGFLLHGVGRAETAVSEWLGHWWWFILNGNWNMQRTSSRPKRTLAPASDTYRSMSLAVSFSRAV